MPCIEFKKTYYYWEDKKTYKAGEIIDVDYDHFRELISTGVAVAAVDDCETVKAFKYLQEIKDKLTTHVLTQLQMKIIGKFPDRYITFNSKLDKDVQVKIIEALIMDGMLSPEDILSLYILE